MDAIAVTIIGSGKVAELLAQRIKQRTDLKLTDVLPNNQHPSSDCPCVVYLPGSVDLVNGTAAELVISMLLTGINVVTTAPAAALKGVSLLEACREGGSSFHGSGGFQSSLVTRFNRAFASITRNIQRVELTEELDLQAVPAHPWSNAEDAGFAAAEAEAVTAQAACVEGYYEAGLRTLSEAVFEDAQFNTSVEFTAFHPNDDDGRQRVREATPAAADQVVVRRSLGANAVYDSIWTRRDGNPIPLQYQLRTVSADAAGIITLSFHAESETSPMDHLTCNGLLDAIIPTVESAPGILHHDLEINQVMPDHRLRG